jgi:hypothetical protein
MDRSLIPDHPPIDILLRGECLIASQLIQSGDCRARDHEDVSTVPETQ